MNTALIILLPDDGAHQAPVANSTVVLANCGHRGFVAPVSRDYIEANQTTMRVVLICGNCLPSGLLDDPEITKYLVPGSKEEIIRTVGVSEADQMIAYARDHGFTEEVPDGC